MARAPHLSSQSTEKVYVRMKSNEYTIEKRGGFYPTSLLIHFLNKLFHEVTAATNG
jgi:hypothetical protein